MDEQFDKDLRNRIRVVFEDHEDPSASEGWLRLREKFPVEQRRRPVAWLWFGTAAAVLLLVGITFWINNEQSPPKKFTYRKTKPTITEKLAGAKGHAGKENHTGSIKADDGELRGKQDKIKSIKGSNAQQLAEPLPNSTRTTGLKRVKINLRKKSAGVITSKLFSDNVAAKNEVGTKKVFAPKITDSIKSPLDNVNEQKLAVNAEPKSLVSDSTAIAAKEKQPANPINSLFAQDKQSSTPKNGAKADNNSRKVRFAVYAATYFNYAKGSDNQLNIGAGFTSDIPLNKNLKLVTGVSIGQNSLSYSGSTPAAASVIVPAAVSLKTQTGAFYSLNGTYLAPANPTLKNYRASLVGLDIPVNFKYEFNPQKNNIYILAGLSSGTFINETYTTNYNYPAQQAQDQTSRNSFNGFYFAKTLNLAIGTGFTLGKNRLIVEPFLKYPLQGLGAQQLFFGAGGINLKFNFQPAKK
jgi:hypothetical protein